MDSKQSKEEPQGLTTEQIKYMNQLLDENGAKYDLSSIKGYHDAANSEEAEIDLNQIDS